MARLTDAQRKSLAQALADGRSPTELAKEYGVSRSSIYRVSESAKAKAVPTKATPNKKAPAKKRVVSDSDSESSDSGSDDSEDDASSDGGSDASVDSEVSDGSVASDASLDSAARAFQDKAAQFVKEVGLSTTGRKHQLDDAESISSEERRDAIDQVRQQMNQMSEEPDSYDEAPVSRPAAARNAYIQRASAPRLPEFSADRGKTIQRIMFNVEHFKPLIVQIIGDDPKMFIQSLATKGDAELDALLDVIERTRSVGNLSNMFRQGFYTAAVATEMVTTTFLGMQTQGFTETLQAQDNEVTMCMKELAIDKYDSFSKMNNPTARLGMLFVTTLLHKDTANRAEKAHSSAEVPASTTEKYSDL